MEIAYPAPYPFSVCAATRGPQSEPEPVDATTNLLTNPAIAAGNPPPVPTLPPAAPAMETAAVSIAGQTTCRLPYLGGPAADRPCAPRWQALLPAPWRHQAVPPQSFRVDREYEVPARRVLGHDRAGKPCFCAYDYRLIEPRSDDGEEFYAVIVYGESVQAWRLTDGRWLVRQRVQLGADDELHEHIAVAERMPR